MKILVIGGTGFLGRRVVEAVSARQHNVWTLGRTPSPGQHISLDRSSPGALKRTQAEHSFDAVVDLAAYHPRDVIGVTRVFESSITRYIFISSGVVHRDLYGAPAREEDVLIPEGDPPDDELDYTWGKRWCEAVLLAARSRGFPAVSLRPPAVLGDGDKTSRIAGYLARIADGGPLLAPRGCLDRRLGVVWSRDVGEVCALLLDSEPRSEAYNVAFEDLTLGRFVREAAAAIELEPPELVEVEEATLEKHGLGVYDVSPYGPARARPGGYDLTRLRTELGFEPSGLATALAEVAGWFRRERPTSRTYANREIELSIAASLRD